MLIGVPKEIKNNENRIGLTPAGAEALVKAGHQVLVEQGGGLGSGFADEDYVAVGMRIILLLAHLSQPIKSSCLRTPK